MSKTVKIILAIIIAGFVGLLAWSLNQKSNDDMPVIYVDEVQSEPAAKVKLVEAGEKTGGIADNVKGGDVATAKIVLVEYADYQCPGCATTNPWINEVLAEYDGQVALVYRSYLLNYHANARSSAAAANAAALQGYWKKMADKLFATQDNWGDMSESEATELFVTYFEEVSEGAGDLAQFREDMASEAVGKKIDADVASAKALKLSATPALYYNNEAIDWYSNSTKADFVQFLRDFIDNLLEEIENEAKSFAEISTVTEMAAKIDASQYDLNTVIPASAATGGFAEKVMGDAATAKVIIYEYADYQCEYCAYFNDTINDIAETYPEQVAVVFRTYVMSYHKRGVQAASAAEAANNQGYWKVYKNKLFAEQENWKGKSEEECNELFEGYFTEVSGGKGDLAQFRKDIYDKNIAQKLAFDMALSKSIPVQGTPSFFIDGEDISVLELKQRVAELLANE